MRTGAKTDAKDGQVSETGGIESLGGEEGRVGGRLVTGVRRDNSNPRRAVEQRSAKNSLTQVWTSARRRRARAQGEPIISGKKSMGVARRAMIVSVHERIDSSSELRVVVAGRQGAAAADGELPRGVHRLLDLASAVMPVQIGSVL